jgi:mono/diheme cytochrome c family protein
VKLLFIAALIASCAAQADEPKLTIQSGSRTVSFTLSDLLKRPSVQTVTVSADPAYAGQARTYRAVPAAELFRGIEISASGTVVFNSLDGFSGPLNKSDLLNTDPRRSIAFIALEDPNKKWAPLKPGQKATAGPFYLIWQNPERSNIAREMWPFQLAGLAVKADLASLFPKIIPKSQDKNAQAGFTSFIRNCFMCHTLNGQGTSQLGPDLNIPFNPTEYMGEKYLRQLIRDPQSLRRWPQSKMPGFSSRDLADSELDQIVAYLRSMSGQKTQ